MKGLKKIALASAIAAISAGAQAELKALDDSAMGELTGQAGLTIDVETEWTIGEFAYQDAGYVLLQGISMGGSDLYGGGKLDNVRLYIDVASQGESLEYGFSELTDLAGMVVNDYSNTDATINAIAANAANLNDEKTYGDGDLVIHIDATDHLARMGGFTAAEASLGALDFATFVPVVHGAVDFKYSIDAIGLAASTYTVGSSGLDTDGNHTTGTHEGAAGTTTLISGLSIQGYLGNVDIHIENHGNGFDGSGALGAGTGNADSQIHWDSYVDVTDLDVYIDIAGVQLTDIKINNTLGDTTDINGKESFGFAHTMRTIYAVKDAVFNADTLGAGNQTGANTAGYVDGIAINTEYKGDMQIGALSFGDTGTSIGQIFLTDVRSSTNWTISAH